MIRETYSAEPLADLRDVDQKKSTTFKPLGLWYSCGDEWSTWNKSEQTSLWKRSRHRYQIDLDLRKILRIRTVKEFDAFSREYAKWNDRLEADAIDWPRVAMEYDGIEICPYRPTRREKAAWYQGWDVASGCVWSASAVIRIRELPFEPIAPNPKIVGFVANGPVHWKQVVHHLDETDPNAFGGRSTIGHDADQFTWTLERRRLNDLPHPRIFNKESVPKYAELIRGGSVPPAIVIAERTELPFQENDQFEIWDGNHRLAAAKRTDLDEVDVYVGRMIDQVRSNPAPTHDDGIGSAGVNKTADHHAVRVMMRPSVFLSLASPLRHRNSVDWLKGQLTEGKQIAPPFLIIRIPEEWFDGDMSEPARVTQHEGRNRMTALLELHGDRPIEVLLWEPDIRRREYEEAWIDRLRSGMVSEIGEQIDGPLFESSERTQKLMPNRAAPFFNVRKIFDECFDTVDDQFPDFGELELHEDDVAGSDNGAGSERQFGYCKNAKPIIIAFAPKTEKLPIANIRGLMRHEFGHAIDFRYGKALGSMLGKRLPDGVERRADRIAEIVFGDPIEYDARLIQCIACGGVSPRPKKLGA